MNFESVKELSLPGVLAIQPKVHSDERGFFVEIYNEKTFVDIEITAEFVQDNLSYSEKNVLRGLHFQMGQYGQDKLVRCPKGRVVDVVADINPDSGTFGKSIMHELTGELQNILYIPKQYAHGYCVLSEGAYFEYKTSNFYSPENARGVMYNDPVLNIEWPISDPILSGNDTSWPALI